VSNRDKTLLPGVYVQLKFVITRAAPRWLIPADTLVIRADGSQVATVGEGRKMHYQKGDIGRDYGGAVEIVSGLNGTQSLITNPRTRCWRGPLSRSPQSALQTGRS
jgi:hypothetical protein